MSSFIPTGVLCVSLDVVRRYGGLSSKQAYCGCLSRWLVVMVAFHLNRRTVHVSLDVARRDGGLGSRAIIHNRRPRQLCLRETRREREKEKGTFNSPPSVHLITTDNQSIIVYMICYLAISHKICRRARFLFFYHTHKAFVGTVLQPKRLRIQKVMRVQKSGSTIHVARTFFDVNY